MVLEQSVPEVSHTKAAMTEEENMRCMAMLDNLLVVTKKQLVDLMGLAHHMEKLEAAIQPLVASVRTSPPSVTTPTSTSVTAMGYTMVAATPSAEANPTAKMPARCSTVCLDRDTSVYTSAFTLATTPSASSTITELDIASSHVITAQPIVNALTTDTVSVTPTKCSTGGSGHVIVTDSHILAHPRVDKAPSVPSLRSIVVTKLDTEVPTDCLTEGPRLDIDDSGTTDLAFMLPAGLKGMLSGFAINNGPTSVLDNVCLRVCSCGCYHAVLSTTSSALLGASYIIPNIIQAAPNSVPQGHLTTCVILTLTSKGDELSHLHILCLPNDHKGFEEMSDRSTMERWPLPREWVKRQPWPPPAQVIISGNEAEPRPVPWPSFKCYYREVSLQAANKEGDSANSDAQGGKYPHLSQGDTIYVMVVELNQGAVVVVDKFCEVGIGAVELRPRRLPPMQANSRCVIVVRGLLKHMVEWSRRLVEIKWWPPPTHKKIMCSRGMVGILLPPALVAITSNGSEKLLADVACELQPKPMVLFMRSPSDWQERLKSSRPSPINESTVCRIVNLLVLMVSGGDGKISSSWSCSPDMEVAVPVVDSQYSDVEQLKYGERTQDTVHEYCSSINFLDGNNCSPWNSLCISDQLHGKSGNSTEETPVKKVYRLFLVMLHVEIQNPEHVLCSSTQPIISWFIDCKSCRVSVGTQSSKVAVHFMERHTKMDQKLHEGSNYDQLLQLSHVLCGQKGCLDPENFNEFKLGEKRQLSHNVAKFKFVPPTPTSVLGFPIDQHTSCRGQDAAGEEVIKPFTPTTLDSHLGYFELVIKMYPQRRMSHHFHGHGLGQVVLKYILDGYNFNQGRLCGFSSFFVEMNLMREGSYEAKSNYCTSEEQQKRGVLARLAGFQVIPNVCCRTCYELLNLPQQSVQIGSILSTHMLTGAICGTLISWHLLVYEVVAKEVSIASHELWRSAISDGRLAAGIRIASTLVSWRGRIHLCCFHYSGLGTSQISRREECHGPNYFGWVSLGLVD